MVAKPRQPPRRPPKPEEPPLIEAPPIELERYRLFFLYARDIVLFIRMDGRIVEANEAALAAYGYSRDELLSLRIFDLRDPATAHMIPGQMFQADIQGITFQTRHRRKDGSVFPVEVSSRGAEVGNERLLLSIVRDATERALVEKELRDSEARYRDLFENANDIIYTLDLEGRVTSLNKRAEEALGVPVEECLGRSVAEWVPAEQVPRMHEALRRKMSGPEARTTYELELVRPDGTRVPVEVSSRLILCDGRPVGIQGIARDIRERKAAERALQEADQRKDHFLAVLGHELRNPLAPMRNAVDYLKSQDPAPEAAPALGMLDRQVRTLARLTEDLLNISRIAQGKMRLHLEEIDLADVVRRAVETARPLIEQRRHALTVALAAERLRVTGDAIRLEQVLTNLLHNAAKFTDPGGRLRVEARREGAEAMVLVRDSGMGMISDAISSLFEPFRQAEGLPRQGQEGLGIGLALVRGIVELHGGRVTAHSDGPGKGSEFRVWLPLRSAGEPPALR